MISLKNNKIFAILLLVFLLNFNQAKKINNINNNNNNDNNNDILKQIISKTSSNNNNNQLIQSNELKRKIVNFINNIIPVGAKSTCNNRLLQSDVQAEMKRLKSFISTCSGYCRLAMAHDGAIYASKEFNLDGKA
jgi:hypothetical protein